MRRAALLALALLGCGGPDPNPGSSTPAPSAMRLVDGTTAAGLDGFVHLNGTPTNRTIDESFGAGVALFDVDGDGDLDAFLCNGGGADGVPARNALFRNDGDGHFEDATADCGLVEADWSYGALARDFDGDGDTDLYVTNNGPNRLYENRDGLLVDVGAELGVADPRWSTGAAFFDYDRDGDLDLYVANHIALDRAAASARTQDFFGLEVYYGPLGLDPEADALYRREADGSFTDVSSETGIDQVAYYSFQVVAFDWDRDGWTDLYVAGDSTPNVLWHNQGGARFVDVAEEKGVALSVTGDPQAGMGVAVGDANGDGRDDLYVTNFSEDYSTLYRGGEQGIFRDMTAPSGLYRVSLASLGWAALFEDLDADGDLDLFVANGHVFPQVDRLGRRTRYRQLNQLFENEGDGRFHEAVVEGPSGLDVGAASRGAAVGDVDGDGRRDVLVGNLDGPPTLLLNRSEQGAQLVLSLVGAAGNRDAIGARVEARSAGATLVRHVGEGSGFLSSGDLKVHLGLGDSGDVDVRVVWADGTVEELGRLDAGQVYTVVQGAGVSERERLGR